MAEPTINDVFVLPAETRRQLEELGPTQDKVAKALDVLDTLGIDTAPLRTILETAKKQREILLKDFG